jgi:NADH dehydrogenase FAD-containing subunit
MEAPAHVVLVGGGHAAAAFVNSVRRAGYQGRVTLISDEPVPPYHRPPLSKKYIANALPVEQILIRAPAWYEEQQVTLRLGNRVAQIDRAARCVVLDGGERIGYDRLVLLTGARARRLPAEMGGELPGVLVMRSLADADALAPHLAAGKRLLVVGGGYIGLEAAAVAATKGLQVTLLEAAPRILPPLSDSLAAAATELLSRLDVDVRTSERVTQVAANAVHTADGKSFPADLVVWAAGIMAPEVLRHLDGLAVNRANQLIVLPTLQTTEDPDVFAFGDCAAAPWQGHGPPGTILPPRAQVAHQQASMLVKTIRARFEGRPLPGFRFRDFGSLVSLGELSAVGNLMGRLIGGSMLIQGMIARAMYASLYKMHQVSIHGYVRVGLDTVGRFLRNRLTPRIKLH